MKKLISISIAMALLVTFVAPVAVAADYPFDPGAYSKTPFGILGSAIQLVGTVVSSIPLLADMIPFDVAAITGPVGEWTWVNLAWMTDMTGWSMVAVGDVLTVLTPIGTAIGFDLTGYLQPVSDVFYVLGARVFDNWGDITSTGQANLPGPGIGLPDDPPGYPRP